MGTKQRSSSLSDTDVNLFSHVRVVWTHRRLVGITLVVTFLVILAISLFSTKIYVSTATILAPQETRGVGMTNALAASAMLPSIPGLSLGALTPNRDIFISILKSRTMAEEVVKRFNLQEAYRLSKAGDVVRRVQESVTVNVSKEGVVSVKVEAPGSQLAADIANFYCKNLDNMLARFSTTEASRQKSFITERLQQTRKDLEIEENALTQFQEMHKAIALQEQAKGAVDAAGKLKGEIVAAEVQLEVLRNYATDANSEVINLQKRIAEMKRQLVDLRSGKEWEVPSMAGRAEPICEDMSIEVTFTEYAELGLELARLTREVKVQETVYSMLTQQLEQAKIAEAKDVPAVQILDMAVPPDRSSRPDFMANLVLGGLFGLLGSIFASFCLEYWKSQKRALLKAEGWEPKPALGGEQSDAFASTQVRPRRRRRVERVEQQ